MKKAVISRNDIIAAGKAIVLEEGFEAISMRKVADKCKVAIGSLYNYYPSKEDLIIGIIASIWDEAIFDLSAVAQGQSFAMTVKILFTEIEAVNAQYPAFLSLHAVGLGQKAKIRGRTVMDVYFTKIKAIMAESLDHDQQIKDQVFDDDFTAQKFIDFILSNLITAIIAHRSCDYLLTLLNKVLY